MRCNVLRRPPQNHNLTTWLTGFRLSDLGLEACPHGCGSLLQGIAVLTLQLWSSGSGHIQARVRLTGRPRPTFVAVMCTLLYRRDVISSSSSS